MGTRKKLEKDKRKGDKYKIKVVDSNKEKKGEQDNKQRTGGH